MRKKELLLILLIAIYSSVFTQKTAIYTHQYKAYNNALELFNKQKYGVAQKMFEKVISTYKNENTDIKTDAEYFSAICAIELFNSDAEYLISKFIIKHPESPRIKSAYFQMGKYQYRKKRYKKAIKWLTKSAVQSWNREAQLYLGTIYYNGEGVAKDYKNALHYFEDAAMQGSTEAQIKLGIMFYKGEGTPMDKPAAEFLLRKSMEDGNEVGKKLYEKYNLAELVKDNTLK